MRLLLLMLKAPNNPNKERKPDPVWILEAVYNKKIDAEKFFTTLLRGADSSELPLI